MNFNYIHINSKDRNLGSLSASDFNVNIGQGLYLDQIQLDAVQIPYTYYNVNSTNNTLVINWNSSNTTLTISPGNYTLSQLGTALNSAVGTINSNITCTLNSIQWTFTFSFSAASPSTGQLILSQSTINRLIGFPSTTDTTNSSNLTSTSVALLLDQAFLFINIDGVGDNIISSTNGNKYTFYVPVSVVGGEMLVYQTDLDQNQVLKVNQPVKYSSLHVRLYDNFGNILNLNGSDWSMTIKIYFKE